MKNFILLWAKILDSSIWLESKETRLVWITMLAMKDADGIVRARIPNLAHRARVEPSEAEDAVRVLSSPDPATPDDPNQGIRIQQVEGGFKIVNHEKYQFSTEAKREYWRKKKAEERKKKAEFLQNRRAKKHGPKLGGEATAEILARTDATQEERDRHSDSCLPDNSDPESPL